MGFFLFLVVAIIVIVVVVKRIKRGKAIEDLKTSGAYGLARKIKDELEEKKGYSFGEPHINYIGNAYGTFICCLPGNSYIHITFSEYLRGGGLSSLKNNLRMEIAQGKRYWGIENDNIGILVYSDEESPDMPEYIKIAAEVIKNSGCGACRQIQ